MKIHVPSHQHVSFKDDVMYLLKIFLYNDATLITSDVTNRSLSNIFNTEKETTILLSMVLRQTL
jgi:hypothetical protein